MSYRKVQFARVLGGESGRQVMTPDPGEMIQDAPIVLGYDEVGNEITRPGKWRYVGNWRGTWQLDADTMVGLYKGSDPAVMDYEGEVPPVPRLTSFTSGQLRAALIHVMTTDQVQTALQDTKVRALFDMLTIRDRELSVTMPPVVAGLSYLVTIGALTAAQRDDILAGLHPDWLTGGR